MAAAFGIALAAAQWWAYFDVVAVVAAERLERATPGREQNEIARDSYSYLHYPMIAGIVLVALGLKKTIGDVDDPLKVEIATALMGGLALYLFAHVAFRYRNIHSLNRQRLIVGVLYLALIPLAAELDAIVTVVIATVIFCALIAYEAVRFSEARERIRRELAAH